MNRSQRWYRVAMTLYGCLFAAIAASCVIGVGHQWPFFVIAPLLIAAIIASVAALTGPL